MTRTPGVLSCREVIERASDYVDDVLSAEERAQIEAHGTICPVCPAYLRQLEQTVAAARLVPAEPLPAPLTEKLRALFRRPR